jgi:hypothetical protein
MDNNNNENKGFGYWWHNVFMYHYFKYVVGGAVLVLLVIVLTLDSASKQKYDFGIVVAAGYGINSDQMQPFLDYVADFVGDLDGDGFVNIEVMNINLNTTDAMNQLSRFEVTLNDDAFVLFLLDDKRSRTIGGRGDFDNLESFGFEVDPETPYRVDVSGLPALATFPDADQPGGTYSFDRIKYACIQTWKLNGKSKFSTSQAAAATRLLRAIVADCVPTPQSSASPTAS